MGTLARLMLLDAWRRPRAVLIPIMLALSAGFIVLPDPDAAYATMTLSGARLVYTPAVMGIITGEMFGAFSMLLTVLAMSALVPIRTWRGVFGVTAAPSWKLALGVWWAAFAVALFLLTCIFCGALVRASAALGADRLAGLWTVFTWSYAIGIVAASFAATLYSVLALRLATRPGLMMGATFIAFFVWIAVFGVGLVASVDLDGKSFAFAQLFPGMPTHDLGMGFLFTAHKKPPIHARAVADLFSTPGGIAFLVQRAMLVVVAMAAALALSGPRLAPLVVRSKTGKGLALFGSRISARFGLSGVIVSQIWRAPYWALALLAAAITAETVTIGTPVSVIALGFAWGLYMLRWPELSEAFEQGGLKSLVQPSVLGPWPVRFRIGVNIAMQMSLFALPLALWLAASGRLHGLYWLAWLIAIAPLLCVGLARFRGGATLFSLVAMLWWYLLISGNAPLPPG